MASSATLVCSFIVHLIISKTEHIYLCYGHFYFLKKVIKKNLLQINKTILSEIYHVTGIERSAKDRKLRRHGPYL